jgi:hypothetical protein
MDSHDIADTRREQPQAQREADTTAAVGAGIRPDRSWRFRRGYTDILAATKRKNIIHGLVEIDVTNAHRRLRQCEAAGEDLSFTAFLIHAVARAVDDVDVNTR